MRLQSLWTGSNAVRSIVGLAVGLALSTDGGAFAQAAPVAQGEISVTKPATLSAQEQLEQAAGFSRRGQQLAERLTRMLDEARREKDILRANCVNRKLTEVNANSRNVDERLKAFKAAVQINDQARRDHEYTVLSVLSQKLNALNQEATQCLGESMYEPGASQVITTVPSNAPSIDPSVIPPIAVPPPSVSVPPPTEIPPMDSPTM